MFRGILSTIYIEANKNISFKKILAELKSTYKKNRNRRGYWWNEKEGIGVWFKGLRKKA